MSSWWTTPLMQTVDGVAALGSAARPLIVDSLCTGCCSEAVILQALKIPFEIQVACDPKCESWDFVKANFPGRCNHFFNNVRDVSEGCGGCRVHGQDCTLPQVRPDIAFCGPPCQPYSRQRKRGPDDDVREHKHYPVLQDEMLDYLSARRPHAVVIEEVVDITRAESNGVSSLQRFVESVRALDLPEADRYTMAALKFNGSEWMDLTRHRLYILMVNETSGGQRSLDAWKDKIKGIRALRQLNKPVDPATVTLQDTAELSRGLAAMEAVPAKRKSGEHPKWKTHSAKQRAKLEVSASFNPWTARGGVYLRGIKQQDERARDIIEVAWAHRMQEQGPSCSPDGFFVDMSQDHTRKPWGSLSAFSTVARIYSYAEDREWFPHEHLLVHGWNNPVIPDGMSANKVRNLAGEGWFLPDAATCILSFWLTVPVPGLHQSCAGPVPGDDSASDISSLVFGEV
eukprot:TRINITY_DN50669_c0_g2_i2.p1 TRINITY_DN50669_c0_g2~~TRINITY_DN50669_c0_g2_i2.p1  ORF type:complete len:456 (+),score=59.28 TRINITY_DN50669_c0_g2_i2:192-1559(+)